MAQRGARVALVAGIMVLALVESPVGGRAATHAAPTATAVEVVDTLTTPTAPPPSETAPAETFTITEPPVTETVTTPALPPRTVTLTVAQPSETATSDDSTDWGWVAFGVLAFGLVVGGVVWWWRGRHQKRDAAPPAAG